MIWKTVSKHDDALYVWWNGVLIYKRWLNKGYGKVFDLYGGPFP